jgi:trimeric autotransporter adhesin
MSGTQRLPCVYWLGGVLMLGLGAAACGSKSPTSPTATGTISSVVLGAATVGVGATVQGTVTLNAAAPGGGVAVGLSSSNAAVASVPSSVTVAAGASSASITVTSLAPGSATITASSGGSSRSAPLTVTSGVALASIKLSTASVVGGDPVTGTVTLTAAAPAGGAAVALTGSDPVTVPPTVTVAAGESSATFTVATRAVGGSTSVTITASYGGGSAFVPLAVTRTAEATASFGVTGPHETDTCEMGNNGTIVNCTFNGTTSAAPGTITAWDWSFGVAKTFTQTTTSPVLAMPAADCDLLPPPPLPAGTTWFPMTVKLRIHDSLGNVSPEAVNSGVRIFPAGTCGF